MKKILILLALSLTLFQSSIVAEESAYQNYAKSIFLSIEQIPQKVYVGQVFSIKVKAIVAHSNIDTLSTTFSTPNGIEIINQQSPWVASSNNNTYENTFYFKINTTHAKLPSISVSLIKNKETLESAMLMLSTPSIIQLKKEDFFSNVIANTLVVNKYKTTTFDAKNVMTVLEIEATEANLKDFKLKGIAKSGIDSFSDNGSSQKIYYYAILPNYQKNFEFTYFDLRGNKFTKISLPIVIDNEEVSTQLGLNPKESIFEFYKSIAYAVLAFFFFIILLKYRKWYYLTASLLFLALYFLDQNPLNHIKLKVGSSIKILPMERSTIFYTSEKILDVEKLGERENYIKILLPDGKIGWTEYENISKN
ncbi:MAG: hypothetical protein EOL93_04160 [Epsilonproteobacteria bacterium]|nr:hypothetical protein [Campylobacterota bacterium]